MTQLSALIAQQIRRTPLWLTPFVAAVTAAVAALFIVLDAALAVSLFPLFSLIFGFVGAAPSLMVALWSRRAAPALVAALFIALIAVVPLLDTGPRKAFVRAGIGVQPGMTLSEINVRMRGFPSIAGELDTAGEPQTLTFVNDFGSGDRDGLEVTLAGGRVVSAQFSWD